MSIHKSLKLSNSMSGKRNVLKRKERIERMRKEGRWSAEEKSVFGLPKYRVLGN